MALLAKKVPDPFYIVEKFCTWEFAVYSMRKLNSIPRRYSMMSLL